MSFDRQRGFTLIELMVVLVIIGVIAGVAIPRLLTGLDRGRQKRTMADLHTIGTAIGSYTVDYNRVPAGSSMTTLATALEPDYIRNLPRKDGWGNDILFESSGGIDYTVGSTAKDGGTTLAVIGSGGATNSFAADIIFTNGQFLQWPEGVQD